MTNLLIVMIIIWSIRTLLTEAFRKHANSSNAKLRLVAKPVGSGPRQTTYKLIFDLKLFDWNPVTGLHKSDLWFRTGPRPLNHAA